MNNNPWKKIIYNEDEYYADKDKKGIDELSIKHPNWIQNGKSEQNEFMLGEAINGNFEKSKVVLLFNNPGFSDEGEKKYFDKKLIESIQKCVRLEKDAKLVYVNNNMIEYTHGYVWYTKLVQSFKRLLDKNETETRNWLEDNLCIIEWFGYHTKSFNDIYEKKDVKNIIDHLPTHLFAIDLVKDAIKQKKLIISMRDHKRWIEEINDLKTYSHFYSYIGQNINAINDKTLVKFYDEKIFSYDILKAKLAE